MIEKNRIRRQVEHEKVSGLIVVYIISRNGRTFADVCSKLASEKRIKFWMRCLPSPSRSLLSACRRGKAAKCSGGRRSVSREPVKRAVRRAGLRKIVPLSDTTIYELEQRGEFPRRFYLTPRCVVWDLDEVEAWVAERRRVSNECGQVRAPSPDVRKRKTRPVRRQSPTRSSALTEGKA